MNRGFELTMRIRSKAIAFEPSFNKWSEILIKQLENIVALVKKFPRIETQLYPKEENVSSEDDFLKV